MGSGGGSDPTLWNIFNNRRELTVDIVLAPHWLDKKFAANVAASRLDCFAEVQSNPPNKLSVSDIIANEQYGYTAPSYVGLNVGFVRVFDSYSRKDVWLPMAIFAAMVDLRTTRLTKPWIAPAGTNRGVLSVDETLKKYDDADLDRLAGRNLNPVSYENGYGFTIWGQRTAQLKKSALDRKNVRFNLLYIENNIEISLKQFIFENNTQQTRMRIFDLVDGFLGGVAAAGGLYDYKVVCDDTNNPPSVIDTNRLNVDIYVQPTKTAEIINFTTVVTKTGESFNTVQLQYV
jgi:phage tail sheath protein FI